MFYTFAGVVRSPERKPVKTAQKTATLRAKAEYRYDAVKPSGFMMPIAQVPDGPNREPGPDALFRDDAGKLFLGFAGEGGLPIHRTPLTLITALNAFRWVRDQVAHRRMKLEPTEPDLLDIAIDSIRNLEDQVQAELEDHIDTLKKLPQYQKAPMEMPRNRN